MLVETALALTRGKRKLAAMLLGAAALSYRFSVLGFVAEMVYRLYQRRR